MKQKLTLSFAVVAGCALCFMAGRISLGSDSSVENSSGPPSNQRTGPQAKDSGLRGLRARGHAGTQGGGYEPVARAQLILEIPDDMERTETWLRFLQGLKPGDFAAVYDRIDLDGGSKARRELPLLLDAWAEHDPIAALDHLGEKGREPYSCQSILTVWAAKDPEAALRWVENHRESASEQWGDDANWWLAGAIAGIAVTDVRRATELMEQMPAPNSDACRHAMGAIQRHAVNQGAQAAREWALGLKDEKKRDAAVKWVASNLANTDPENTLDWLIANPSEGATEGISRLVNQLADSDPEAAIAYFEKVSDPEVKRLFMRKIAVALSSSNPQKAFELFDANPDLVNEQQWAYLAWEAGGTKFSPEIAMKAAARIQDSEMYKRNLKLWLLRDVEAATNWVNQNELPDGMTQDDMSQFIEESIKANERIKSWRKSWRKQDDSK